MGLSYAKKKEIAKQQLPSTEAITLRCKEYMAVSGLTLKLFAHHVGVGASTLSMLFAGNYARIAGTNENIIAKLVKFMDAYPATPVEQERGKLYETENVAEMRHWFDYTLENRKICCVYGGPGSQKTFVAEELVRELHRRELSKNGHGSRAFHIYCSQDITPTELIKKIMRAAALPAVQNMQKNLVSLRLFFRNRKVLFIFDEAQHLNLAALEIVRELNDLSPRFGVMLLGSHKLKSFFAARAADMEQWNSRITAVVSLPGIGEERATEIVREEMGGAINFTATKMRGLLDDCTVTDIYSGKKATRYISARQLFNTIEVTKMALAKKSRRAA